MHCSLFYIPYCVTFFLPSYQCLSASLPFTDPQHEKDTMGLLSVGCRYEFGTPRWAGKKKGVIGHFKMKESIPCILMAHCSSTHLFSISWSSQTTFLFLILNQTFWWTLLALQLLLVSYIKTLLAQSSSCWSSRPLHTIEYSSVV